MHLQLVVPGLFPDRESRSGTLRLPALELLLARGRRAQGEPAEPGRWLAQAFALEGRSLPSGAITALAYGLDAGEGCWLRADPVHLKLQSDWLALIPAEGFPIAGDEARELARTVNRHFADAFVVHAPHPERWCLRAAGDIAIDALSPLELAGLDVNANLPRGPDAQRWHALLNELQMLLHAHPVNEAREKRGEPPVNSLWFWGAGRLPGAASGPWHSVSAEEPLALGLARLAKIRYRALARSASEWLERMPEDGRHLVVLDSLRAVHVLGDSDARDKRLGELEERWFAPLLAALKAGRIGMVTVHAPDAGISFETVRGDLRRFWRRSRSLGAYTA